MKKVVSTALRVSLLVGPLLLGGRPARASTGKDVLIGVAVVGVVYYLVKGHHHKKTAAVPQNNSRFFAQSTAAVHPLNEPVGAAPLAN